MIGNLSIFEQFKIRKQYDETAQKWYFSIVDIIQALLQQSNFQLARNYWKVMKNRLVKEGSQLVTNCNQLKLMAPDGKYRNTDVADVETLLRLIQSIPSPKVEPIKLWLAKVGHQRIEEISNPELAVNRARNHWQKLGRSEKWIQQSSLKQ